MFYLHVCVFFSPRHVTLLCAVSDSIESKFAFLFARAPVSLRLFVKAIQPGFLPVEFQFTFRTMRLFWGVPCFENTNGNGFAFDSVILMLFGHGALKPEKLTNDKQILINTLLGLLSHKHSYHIFSLSVIFQLHNFSNVETIISLIRGLGILYRLILKVPRFLLELVPLSQVLNAKNVLKKSNR